MDADFNTAPAEMPAVRDAVAEIPTLETLVRDYSITTAEQYTTGGEDLRRVKAAQKKLEDTRTSITKPMNDALKRVNDFFREPGATLVRIEQAIKRAMTGYDDEQARIRREEQRKADAAAEKERQRLADQAARAAAAGKTEKAEQLNDRAAAVVAPVISREPPKVAGVTTRMVVKHEIVDPSQLPRVYLMPDEKKIAGQVRALGMDANIPGVRVWQEKQIASSAA